MIIATPDHWHAIQTIMACEAGKDVYVEKPLSITIARGPADGRGGAEARPGGAGRHAAAVVAALRAARRAGPLGRDRQGDRGAGLPTRATCRPAGSASPPTRTRPPGLDWDLWLGPRPTRPFNPNIMPYKFRWWQLYSSQMANWGVHYFDAIRWMVGETAPASLSAHGGVFAVDDCRTIPDTAEVIFEHASGMLTTFSTYEASGQPLPASPARSSSAARWARLRQPSNRFEIVPERGGQFQDPRPGASRRS